jgi:2-oxo-4-hydroxy-4-carboxy-5-ureidoimidazoline decarboxylase
MTIADFDHMPIEELKAHLMKCCGSTAWVEKMVSVLPVEDMVDLFECAEEKWNECSEADWKEAFGHHPQIGDAATLRNEDENTAAWAKAEQSGLSDADTGIKQQIAQANKDYFEKFGYIFIINATGKSAAEIFAALEQRLQNSPEVEIDIAMTEQLAITKLRLEKLLDER